MEKRGGRRGSYLSVSAEEKAQVATYASTHSVRTAIKHFSKAFGKDLKDFNFVTRSVSRIKNPEN